MTKGGRGEKMRKGFTLLELLVVVAIMGLLGMAATAGYTSLVRGMNERGAVAVATGILRAAKERAQIDRQPTAVFCYNRLLKAPSKTSDENGVVVGEMVAVRRAGRLSYVQGDLLFDEFADLDVTYDYEEDAAALTGGKTKGMRLYRFGDRNMSMKYSVVAERVLRDEDQLVTVFSGSAAGQETNLLMSAFVNLGASDFEPSAWKVGDAYAFSFSEMQLPQGFVFGDSDIPAQAGAISSSPKVLYFDPESDTDATIDVYPTRPNANGMPEKESRRAGTATSDNDTGV